MRLVKRSDWGAAPPAAVTPLPLADAHGVSIHYSASGADEQADHTRCGQRVKGIQSFHMGPSRGWNDIAYNHLFCKHGYVFEGRGFGVRSAANGTTSSNDRYYAICFLGDDNSNQDDVTYLGRQALTQIISEYDRRISGGFRVRPHSDFFNTSCPGDELRGYIKREEWHEADVTWPIPIPKWFWVWARWKRGDKEFAGHANDPDYRPKSAPTKIPEWAWDRLKLMGGN